MNMSFRVWLPLAAIVLLAVSVKVIGLLLPYINNRLF